MKTKDNDNRELELQNITDGLLSTLELAMTNSAFGFEYALKELEQESQFGIRAEEIALEIEKLKESYFEARAQMGTLDARRLENFENELKVEKTIIFSQPKYLH